MNKIIIIDTYPVTKRQENILFECISRLKPIGYSIMVVSHHFTPNLPDDVNYYIFDDKNHFLPSEMTPHYWFDTEAIKVRVFNAGHSLAITRNMATSVNMAKCLGYEFFYFMEYDVLFEHSDLIELDNLSNTMIAEGKEMIFFKPDGFIECNSQVYETLLFGGKTDYFLNHFSPPINTEKWVQAKMGYTLEIAFYEKFSSNEEKYLIIPTHADRYFKESKVNLYRYGLYVCEVLYNSKQPEKPCLFVSNSHHSPNNPHIIASKNGITLIDKTFGKGEWSLVELSYDDQSIDLCIYESADDRENPVIKSINLNKSNSEYFKKRGDIEFKNKNNMNHFYQDLGEDWFGYQDLYKSVVERFDNAHFVEVGVWKGRSASFMAVEIINSGKNIKFDCVDTWDYLPEQSDIPKDMYDSLYETFLQNIKPVSHIINPVRLKSHIASELYEDNSLDFVFIDASHDYDNVRRDILCWYRKVKKGGILAGDDYINAEGVKRAVDEIFQNKIISGNSWIVYVN